jgi:hypothetical protein
MCGPWVGRLSHRTAEKYCCRMESTPNNDKKNTDDRNCINHAYSIHGICWNFENPSG